MPATTPAQRVAYRHICRDQGGGAVITSYGQEQQAASVGAASAWRGRIHQACWAVVLVALILADLSLPAQAQVIRPFTSPPRFTRLAERGDIYIIGNTLFRVSPESASAGARADSALP